MSRSVVQAAENASVFRAANEKLERAVRRLRAKDEATPYLCECEDESCMGVVRLTREQYEAVRAHSKRFLVLPGHQEGNERLILEEQCFTVIEKVGAEGTLVADRDPRS